MIQTQVESSNVAAVGWQDDKLMVKFNRGDIYRYDGVPLSVYNDFVNAESVGRFFHANIKAYPYTKIEGGIEGFS
jgi:KTSC domain